MLTLGFNLTNEFGYEYSMKSKKEVTSDIYENDLDFFGENFNLFLKQCGYYRKNDYIFMEDVTEDEYEALSGYLRELRSSK